MNQSIAEERNGRYDVGLGRNAAFKRNVMELLGVRRD